MNKFVEKKDEEKNYQNKKPKTSDYLKSDHTENFNAIRDEVCKETEWIRSYLETSFICVFIFFIYLHSEISKSKNIYFIKISKIGINYQKSLKKLKNIN